MRKRCGSLNRRKKSRATLAHLRLLYISEWQRERILDEGSRETDVMEQKGVGRPGKIKATEHNPREENPCR